MGLALGALAGAVALCTVGMLWLRLRQRTAELVQERKRREEAERSFREFSEKYHDLDRSHAEFCGREEERRRANEEKLALLANVREELTATFGGAALKASEEALEKLRQGNREDGERERERLEGILKPMRECVEQLDGRVQRNDRQWNESMARFEEQIRQLLHSSRELDQETKKLSNALHRPHLRGRWGELHLRRLVEMAGLREHVDFEEQVAVAADGNALRADMIIHLPDGRNVVVDAKAVLEAFVAAEGAESRERREELLKQHGQNVFLRIQELGRKDYWKFFGATFEYVVLFLPGDHLYAAAVEVRPDLFDEALERHVLLASPMTFLALLKTIACSWSQEATAKEAAAVVELGKTLMERMQIVLEKFSDAGRHLRRTVEAYNGTVASIESRLRPTLQSFSRMRSIRAAEPPPPDLLEVQPRMPTLEGPPLARGDC
ncbi:MAG: DNA recombination protein RmuC [Puniceicoccales bacterium]|jgi:DNA recombination protein RmuC|nr:DNA recombination protein RmuC [Puniceicoccales bacterium]